MQVHYKRIFLLLKKNFFFILLFGGAGAAFGLVHQHRERVRADGFKQVVHGFDAGQGLLFGCHGAFGLVHGAAWG